MVSIGPALLGDGVTKIAVPMVGKTTADILADCEYIRELPCEVVELRIDFYESAESVTSILELLKIVKPAIGNKGLLFTWRTKQEGGEREISVEDYFNMLDQIIPTGFVDAIDIEYFFDDTEHREHMTKTVALAHKHGVTVVMSNHDFHKTPALDDIKGRLVGMKQAGADVAKLACMPQSPSDVLTVLQATEQVKSQYPDEPLITMAMGQLGVVTRTCGSVFGNALTFGAAKQSSAPGQVEVHKLKAILETVDK